MLQGSNQSRKSSTDWEEKESKECKDFEISKQSGKRRRKD